MFAKTHDREGGSPPPELPSFREHLEKTLNFLRSLEREHTNLLPPGGLSLPQKKALLEIIGSIRGYLKTVTEQNVGMAILNVRERVEKALPGRPLLLLKKELFHILGEPPRPAPTPTATNEKKEEAPPAEDRFLKKRLLAALNKTSVLDFSKVDEVRFKRIKKSIEEINSKNIQEKTKEIQYYIETYEAETKTQSFKELLNRLRSELNLPTQQVEQPSRIVRLEPPRAQEPKDERISFLPEGMAPLPPVPLEEVETPSFIEKDLTPTEGTNIPASAFIRARKEATGITGELKKIEKTPQTVIEPPITATQESLPSQPPQKPFKPLTRPGDITQRYRQQKTEEVTPPLEVASPVEPSSSAEDPFAGVFEITEEDEMAAEKRREKSGIKILERKLSEDRHYKYIGRIDENGQEHSLFGEVTITKLIRGKEGVAASSEYKIKGNFEHGKLVGNASVIYPASKKENGEKIIREIVVEGPVDENFLPHGHCVATNMADRLSFEGTFDRGVPLFGRTIRLVYKQDAQTGSDTYEKQEIRTEDHFVDAFLNPKDEHEGATEEVRRPVTQKIEPIQYEVAKKLLSSSSPTAEDEDEGFVPLTMVGHVDDLLVEEPRPETREPERYALLEIPENTPDPQFQNIIDHIYNFFIRTQDPFSTDDYKAHEIVILNYFRRILEENVRLNEQITEMRQYVEDIENYIANNGSEHFSPALRIFLSEMKRECDRQTRLNEKTDAPKEETPKEDIEDTTTTNPFQRSVNPDLEAPEHIITPPFGTRHPAEETLPHANVPPEETEVAVDEVDEAAETRERTDYTPFRSELAGLFLKVSQQLNAMTGPTTPGEKETLNTIRGYLQEDPEAMGDRSLGVALYKFLREHENAPHSPPFIEFLLDVRNLLLERGLIISDYHPTPSSPEPPTPFEGEQPPETEDVLLAKRKIKKIIDDIRVSAQHEDHPLSSEETKALRFVEAVLNKKFTDPGTLVRELEDQINNLTPPPAAYCTMAFRTGIDDIFRCIDEYTPLNQKRITDILLSTLVQAFHGDLMPIERRPLAKCLDYFKQNKIPGKQLKDRLFLELIKIKKAFFLREKLKIPHPNSHTLNRLIGRLERYSQQEDIWGKDLNKPANYLRVWAESVNKLDVLIQAGIKKEEKPYLADYWNRIKQIKSIADLLKTLQEFRGQTDFDDIKRFSPEFQNFLDELDRLIGQIETHQTPTPKPVPFSEAITQPAIPKPIVTEQQPETQPEPPDVTEMRDIQNELKRKIAQVIGPKHAAEILDAFYLVFQEKKDVNRHNLISKIAIARTELDGQLKQSAISHAEVLDAFENKRHLLDIRPSAFKKEAGRKEIRKNNYAKTWYAFELLLRNMDKLF